MRRLSACLALCAVLSAVQAGELDGPRFAATRFPAFRIELPAGQWLILDREASGDNAYGGPVAEFRSQVPAGSVYPVVMLSAFRRAGPEITADFLLRTSREAMQQKGAENGPVLVRAVDGRKIRFFESRVTHQGKPAMLYYALLEGAETFYAAQVVAPEADFPLVRARADALLDLARY